jgi:hypothetical protein
MNGKLHNILKQNIKMAGMTQNQSKHKPYKSSCFISRGIVSADMYASICEIDMACLTQIN